LASNGLKTPEAKSNSGSVSAGTISEGSSATCPASRPSVIDFSCGFQSNDASGTRSNRLLVVFASCRISAASDSHMLIKNFLPSFRG
jgi:hypothetical protein